MKLAKFYFKHFLFRSTRKVSNIENVIRSHGFNIYRFDPHEEHGKTAQFLELCGCKEYAKHRPAFIFVSDKDEKFVFIQKQLCHDDQVRYLFHEEAHIWYNHPNVTGFVENTKGHKNEVANLFLFRLRILKTITSLVLLSALAVGIYFFPHLFTTTEVYTLETSIEVEGTLAAPDSPQDLAAMVCITKNGDCYHQQGCQHLIGSEIIPFPLELAKQIKAPCKTCQPEQ